MQIVMPMDAETIMPVRTGTPQIIVSFATIIVNEAVPGSKGPKLQRELARIEIWQVPNGRNVIIDNIIVRELYR